jgi:hypothetical protein
MKKTKRSISDFEFFVVSSFLASHKEAFAMHCDGFDYYDDEGIDELIEELAGPEYTKAIKAF